MRKAVGAFFLVVFAACFRLHCCHQDADSRLLPAMAALAPKQPWKQTAVFAGGCLWGTQAVFERVKGVLSTAAGYSGGSAAMATYDQVNRENTGHAESVKVVYDPSKITYGELLRNFFSVAHDPTQLNRQGPDVGSSYRSVDLLRQRRAGEDQQSLHRAAALVEPPEVFLQTDCH